MPRHSPVPPIALFRLLARNAPLAAALEPLGRFNLRHAPGSASSIEPRDRELVIDRTCARTGCEYEWGVHVAHFAPAVGLTEAQIAATVLGDANDPAFTARDRLLVALVDTLHDHGAVNDDLWEALAQEFGETTLLELLVLVGWYHAVSFVANGARLPSEPWAARFPTRPVE
jgi:alkylhydroperoxidase family enzyme